MSRLFTASVAVLGAAVACIALAPAAGAATTPAPSPTSVVSVGSSESLSGGSPSSGSPSGGSTSATGVPGTAASGSQAAVGVVPQVDPLLLQGLKDKLAAAKVTAATATKAYADGIAERVTALAQANELQNQARAAQALADRQRKQLAGLVMRTYTTSTTVQISPAATLLLNGSADGPAQSLQDVTTLTYLSDGRSVRLVNQLKAVQSAASSAQGAAAAADRAAHAADALHDAMVSAQDAVTALQHELTAKIAQLQQELLAKQQAAVASSGTAGTRWKAYLTELSTAGITPPTAAQLADPAHLPAHLRPLTAPDGHVQAGAAVATVHGVSIMVLPREVVAAINSALTKLGLPYVFGATGPRSYDCSGLTMSSFATGGLVIPRTSQQQYTATTAARITPGDELPGDLIFFAGDDGTVAAPGHVGIVLDPVSKLLIQAPQTGDVVKISSYANWPPVGFGRPSIG